MIYNPFCKCQLILFKIQISINFLSLQLACQCFLDEYESYHNISDYYRCGALLFSNIADVANKSLVYPGYVGGSLFLHFHFGSCILQGCLDLRIIFHL